MLYCLLPYSKIYHWLNGTFAKKLASVSSWHLKKFLPKKIFFMTKEANFHNVPNQNTTTATSISTPPDNKAYLEAPRHIHGSKIFFYGYWHVLEEVGLWILMWWYDLLRILSSISVTSYISSIQICFILFKKIDTHFLVWHLI